MSDIIRTLVADFGWIHRGIGVTGNLLFVIGSVLFLPHFDAEQTIGVWMFIAGSALMFVGALGDFILRLPGVEGKDA